LRIAEPLRTLAQGALCWAALAGLAAAQSAPAAAPAAAADARAGASLLVWVGPLSELHRTLAAPLRESRKAPAETGQLLARLTAPGADAIGPLLDMLIEERVPRAAPADAPQLLSAPQRGLLLAALAQLPRASLRAELERRLAPADELAGAPLRVAALHVFALAGGAADLARLAALAPRVDEELPVPAAEALRAAYAGILRGEPGLLARGLALLRGCDTAAASQFLFALGDLHDKRALPLLEDCMRSRPELAQQAIGLLAQLGRSDDPDFDRRVAAWLAGELDNARSEWTRAALRALGVFDDGRQVPALLEELDAPHPGLREAALDSLRQVSGLKLGGSAAAWREWYADESAWQESGEPAARLELASNQDARVARALDQFAAHRLFRDERAPALLEVLENGSPAMRILACSALARLGSQVALPALVDNLSSEPSALADAAWRAACTLSGQTLPRSTAEARALLGTDRE
jgi:HEAT repeat protein